MNNVQKANGFDEFWDEYPVGRKVKKKRAQRAYDKAIKEVSHETIMLGLKAYKAHLESEKTPRKYILHPASWLNDGCWDDELEAEKEMDERGFELAKQRWIALEGRGINVPRDIQRMFNLGPYAKGAE